MSAWKGQNTRGLAIVRVSSSRQEDGISHETQEKEIHAYCGRVGIQLVRVERLTESAKDSADRDQYHATIRWALKNNVRHLLWYMTDREVRNFTDLEAMEKLIRKDQIVVHYVRDNRQLWVGSPLSDFSMREIEAWRDKQLSRTISAKMSDAMRQKAENGWYPGNWLPLGYVLRKQKDSTGRELKRGAIPVRDPDERKVRMVRREFELRAEGYSYQQVRDRVLAEGLVSAEMARSYRANTVEKRISNPFYAGSFSWQGVLWPGKHELIIPPDLYEKARGLRRSTKTARDHEEHGVLAGGWIRCAECGCSISYDPKKKTYRSGKQAMFHYYRCANGKKLHSTVQYVPEEWLWEQLGHAVENLTMPPETADLIADALNDSYRASIGQALKRVESLKAQLAKLKERELRAQDALLDGTFDRDGYLAQREKLKGDRERVERDLDLAHRDMRGGFRETAESTFELCKNAKELWISRSPRERRVFLELLLSNPRLRGRTMEYEMKKPFGLLAQMKGSLEWRPLLDDLRTQLSEAAGGFLQ